MSKLTKQNFKEIYLEHVGSTITHDFEKPKYDISIETATTADSYELFVVREDSTNYNIDISEDVYYYNNDLTEKLKDSIDCGMDVYMCEGIYDELYIDGEWEEWCHESGLIEWDDDSEEFKIVGDE